MGQNYDPNTAASICTQTGSKHFSVLLKVLFLINDQFITIVTTAVTTKIIGSIDHFFYLQHTKKERKYFVVKTIRTAPEKSAK